MALRIKVDASMKARTGTTVHCSASPRTAAYYAKARRDGLNARHIYTALLCGAVCFSTWALLSHQVSSSLPTHGPGNIWPGQPSGSSSDSSAGPSLRRGSSSLLFASVHRGSSSSSSSSSSVPGGGAAAVAAAAAVLGSKAATRRLTFQRTKTAMPFIMMTCRMCDDPMSQQIAAIKMYDPVTSTLVEHALSNTDDESRVFVEVGAGTGYFSMLAASWGTDVVAFEPNATARQMLHYNAGLHKDGRVRIVPYALGAKTTLATILNQQQNSSDSSSNTTSSSSNSTAGPSPTFTPATTPTNSSTNSSKGWPVDVLRLSDAIAGDAKMTVLLVNVPSLNGVSVPGFVEAAEGAYDMLKRVQWVFLLGVPDYNTPAIHSVLTNMLARGNFSNLYSYGRPSEQQLAQGDDAQYEEGQQQQQQQQQEQQQGGNAADGSKAAAAAASSSYPADTHYVDITEAIQQPDAEFALTHSDFLFTRAPLSGTLHINMPKKLVWDWQVPPAVASPAPAAAGAGAGAAGAAGGNNSTAAAVAGGAAATPVPAGPMGPAPAAGAQEAGAAGSEPKERMVTVYTPVPGTQKQQQ